MFCSASSSVPLGSADWLLVCSSARYTCCTAVGYGRLRDVWDVAWPVRDVSTCEVNHEAAQIGDLEKNLEAIKVVSHAEVQQGDFSGCDHDASSGRGGYVAFLHRPVHGAACRRGGGVKGAEWENLYCKLVEMNKDISPGGSSGAKMLWTTSEAEGSGDEVRDPASNRTRFGRNCGPSTCRTQSWRCLRKLALRRQEAT